MRRLLPLALLLLAAPAAAQSLFDQVAGLYGSLNDPATSCDTNPHRLEFTGPPLHALLSWAEVVDDPDEGPTRSARYDIYAADDTSITLRREGSRQRSDSGDDVIWILRPTSSPEGYCWGRADKPSVFCERPQVRCGDPAPTS